MKKQDRIKLARDLMYWWGETPMRWKVYYLQLVPRKLRDIETKFKLGLGGYNIWLSTGKVQEYPTLRKKLKSFL